MQLIRAINKSNKSNNNNNQTSSGTHFSKVVIVAPPATNSSVSQSHPPQAPASPALPALKKRTTVVKQSVPPPVPPRGSPRSKSKCIGVASSRRKPTIDVNRLSSLSSLEQSGCQKVEKWLESVVIPSITDDVEFKSVKKLAENFTSRHETTKKSSARRKVSDSSVVRIRVESYDSLVNARLRHFTSDAGTDSGIDIPARATSRTVNGSRKLLRTFGRFSRDEEFV